MVNNWQIKSCVVLLTIILVGGLLGWLIQTQITKANSRSNPMNTHLTNAKIGDTCKNTIDNAEMVWVPCGSFTMGSPTDVGDYDEHPAHKVTLSGYWIYKFEVTVAQYRTFCSVTRYALPPFPTGFSWKGKSGWANPALQQHPIVNVNWKDAKAYADWAKVTLPTEAQWEYAARGLQGSNYPWGGTATTKNLTGGWNQTKCANGFNSANQDISTWKVGSFPRGVSWCGAQDLAGNVYEWCGDRSGTYSSTPVTNPTGSIIGWTDRMQRGGSWMDGDESKSRGASCCIGDQNEKSDNTGFRGVSITN